MLVNNETNEIGVDGMFLALWCEELQFHCKRMHSSVIILSNKTNEVGVDGMLLAL